MLTEEYDHTSHLCADRREVSTGGEITVLPGRGSLSLGYWTAILGKEGEK